MGSGALKSGLYAFKTIFLPLTFTTPLPERWPMSLSSFTQFYLFLNFMLMESYMCPSVSDFYHLTMFVKFIHVVVCSCN